MSYKLSPCLQCILRCSTKLQLLRCRIQRVFRHLQLTYTALHCAPAGENAAPRPGARLCPLLATSPHTFSAYMKPASSNSAIPSVASALVSVMAYRGRHRHLPSACPLPCGPLIDLCCRLASCRPVASAVNQSPSSQKLPGLLPCSQNLQSCWPGTCESNLWCPMLSLAKDSLASAYRRPVCLPTGCPSRSCLASQCTLNLAAASLVKILAHMALCLSSISVPVSPCPRLDPKLARQGTLVVWRNTNLAT